MPVLPAGKYALYASGARSSGLGSTSVNCGGLFGARPSSANSQWPWTSTSHLQAPVDARAGCFESDHSRLSRDLAHQPSPARTTRASPSSTQVTGTTSGRALCDKARWPEEALARSERQRSSLSAGTWPNAGTSTGDQGLSVGHHDS